MKTDVYFKFCSYHNVITNNQTASIKTKTKTPTLEITDQDSCLPDQDQDNKKLS